MSRPDDIAIPSGGLGPVATALDTTGSDLFEATGDLQTLPDAGLSTDEVAGAIAALVTAVSGLADLIGGLADSTLAAERQVTTTDQGVGADLHSRRP